MTYRRSRSSSLGPVWLIIGLNIIVFIASVINPDVDFLLGLRPLSFPNEPWTLLTSIFAHGSFWHVFFNMLTLYFLGSFLLNLVGEARFWLVYLGGGILGSLFFVWLGPPFALVVGASGALFSVGGVLAVLRPRVPVMVFPIPVPIPLVFAIIGGFVILSFLPGVAWEAHLGGLVFGLIAGYFFRRRGTYRL